MSFEEILYAIEEGVPVFVIASFDVIKAISDRYGFEIKTGKTVLENYNYIYEKDGLIYIIEK